jgi:hypothetical protein
MAPSLFITIGANMGIAQNKKECYPWIQAFPFVVPRDLPRGRICGADNADNQDFYVV